MCVWGAWVGGWRGGGGGLIDKIIHFDSNLFMRNFGSDDSWDRLLECVCVFGVCVCCVCVCVGG